MGKKTHPFAFRLGGVNQWRSRWFDARSFPIRLKEDAALRDYLAKKLKKGLVESVEIERTANRLLIAVNAARPGLLIGRGGGGAEEIRRDVVRLLEGVRGTKEVGEVRFEIREAAKPESNAAVVCQQVADQLERRLPFRMVMKRTLEKIFADKGVGGARIRVSGRLGGAEMSRSEHLERGKIPLHTIRANIDYSQCIARTTYGVIGVKVWTYRGEVFKDKTEAQKQ